MSEPQRIQLSRKKGWRMPANTVKVDRTTRWGNPFALGEPVERGDGDLWPFIARQIPGGTEGLSSLRILSAELAVQAFSWWILEQPGLMLSMADELGGRNLACWCRLPRPGEPDYCHAADLLSLVAELVKGENDGV